MSTQEVGQIFGEGSGPEDAMLRSPTVIIASIGLWGMNVYFFNLFKINYVKVLNADLVKEQRELKGQAEELDISDADDTTTVSKEDQEPLVRAASTIPLGNRITAGKLICLSLVLLCLLHLTTYIWMNVMDRGTLGAVFCFYGTVTIAICFPLPSTRWLRTSTILVLQRAIELLNPRCSCIYMPSNGPRPIPFIDVFFADAMCSFSKVFFDWGMLWHMASYYGQPVPKSTHNILIPSFFAAIPYLIRARQCVIMHRVGLIKVSICVYATEIHFSTIAGINA
jgi:EXS family